MNAIIIIVKSVNLCTQLRSSFGMYELRYGNLQKTFYRDNFRSLLYAAISHITHHALRRYLNRHNEMHFLCLTKKLNLKMIFIVGIKKIDNTNCYIIHYQQQQKREFRMCIKKYDECICPDQWVYYNVLKLQTLAAATGKNWYNMVFDGGQKCYYFISFSVQFFTTCLEDILHIWFWNKCHFIS